MEGGSHLRGDQQDGGKRPPTGQQRDGGGIDGETSTMRVWWLLVTTLEVEEVRGGS